MQNICYDSWKLRRFNCPWCLYAWCVCFFAKNLQYLKLKCVLSYPVDNCKKYLFIYIVLIQFLNLFFSSKLLYVRLWPWYYRIYFWNVSDYQMTSPVPYHSPKKLQSHHHICVPFLEKEFWIYSICRNKHACSRKKRTLTLSMGLALFIWSQSFEDIIENL